MSAPMHITFNGGLPPRKRPARVASAVVELEYDEAKHPRGYHGRWGEGDSPTPNDRQRTAEMLKSVPMVVGDPAISKSWDAMQAEVIQWKVENDGEALHYQELVDKWSSSMYGSGAEPLRTAAMSGSTEDGRQLAALLDAAPVIDQPLYRGVVDDGGTTWAPGDVLTLGPSSFSASAAIGDQFAMDPPLRPEGPTTPVVMEVQAGARGVPVGSLSNFNREQEVISAGKFEVVSSEMKWRFEGLSTYPRDPEGRYGQRYVVVKQVDA